MSQVHVNRVLLTPKCFFMVAICMLIICIVLITHHDQQMTPQISKQSAANNNNSKSDQRQQAKDGHTVAKMGTAADDDGMNNDEEGKEDDTWLVQQERDLTELYALAKCNSSTLVTNLTQKIDEPDDDGDAIGLKMLPMNDWSVMCRGLSISRDFDSLMRPHCRDRYLLPDYTHCSGLGNQMFRFASLYGIGRLTCRRPIFVKKVQECVHGERQKELYRHHDLETADEIERIFPLYSTQLKYVDLSTVNASDIHYVEGFATKCCTYDDPSRVKLHALNQKYVQFKKTDFLQNYKFFDGRRRDMRQIFQFSPTVCKSVLSAKCKMFEADRTSHKLCVHNRLGDFIQSGWQSDLSFTVHAIKHIGNELKAKFGTISVVLLGFEKDFLHKIEQQLDKKVQIPGSVWDLELSACCFYIFMIDVPKAFSDFFAKVYLPESHSRGEDFAFATVACDSLLITAPASTFSWWMAYLMPDNSPIYYSAHLERTPRGKDSFLKEWAPLRLVNGTTIIREN